MSEDVDYVTCLKPLPFALHGYVWPFALGYVLLLVGWTWLHGPLEQMEGFFIGCAIIGVLNIVTCLFCVWSVHIRCKLTCSKVSSVEEASMVKVVPTQNNGSTELVSIVRQKHKVTGEPLVWFMFQKTKYVYNLDKKQFDPVLFPISKPFADYHSSLGYENEAQLAAAKQIYGKNKLDMTSPDFWSLFKERATAPFFVFQVFCVGLWCLDEYWYYSIFTLFMLVTFEAVLVKQQQRNLSEIRKMGTKPFQIQAFRSGKWHKMSTQDLLPGDIISIGRPKEEQMVPCDILLLAGPCIVDESMLTGESVPQMKEPLDPSTPDHLLDLSRDSRLHVISGGTRIVQHTPPDKHSAGLRAPDNGCVGYVLRTGFNTGQGKLLRTILYGVKRVTANNMESFVFILFLLVFAVVAAVYVWIKGKENPDRNRYKLFLECTLILTSVVPPELPIELSLAVNTSLVALAKIGIYCTEPFRIPFGGKVDVCCFDKTGTLTSDNLIVQGIAGLPPTPGEVVPDVVTVENDVVKKHKPKVNITPIQSALFETQCVLATCQSLAVLDGELVGDPMEKAAINAIDWNVTKDSVSPKRGRKTNIKICTRFHFSSALKRMSCISSMQTGTSGPAHMVTTKGAPETLRDMFEILPDDYDAIHTKLARQGARVLALGYRDLGSLSLREVYQMKREDAERSLRFEGFLVISCPLKQDSKQNIQCLLDSSHYVTMLTGDSPLTACHVAKELKISQNKQLVLAQARCGNEWVWQKVGGDVAFPLADWPKLRKQFDLCLTGDGVSYLLHHGSRKLFAHILPSVKVFARVAPKQKELVVTTFKALGYNTLMCGDGTNDVGALKHAHVGVALLSSAPGRKKEESAADGKEDSKSSEPKKESSVDAKPLSRTPLRNKKNLPPPKALSTADRLAAAQEQRKKRLKELMKDMEDMEPRVVRLGDASIASPFTSRHSSIACICHVVKQGRCTLVTTLQMFKILALNALILAYSQSVLYLDGIKFSDMQATVQGFLLAGCFLFISRSKPLSVLSKERPLPNIFNVYTVLTVCSQFFVHFSCLVYLVRETKSIVDHKLEDIDLEKEFEQNELNSAVYLISIAMQISNFAVNYKGHPFMASLTENRPLLYSLLVSASALFVLASGLFPDISATFEIEVFSEEFRYKLLIVLLCDLFCSFLVDRALALFLGTSKARLTVNCKHSS